jgi:N utilization substance protein A
VRGLPEIKLSADQLGLISIFSNMSGATVRDCIVDDRFQRLIFVINKGQMGLAIGKGGSTIQNVERVIKKAIDVVEWSDDPAEMVRNALDPRAVQEVRLTEKLDGTMAMSVIVDPKRKGAVLGREGKNAEKVRLIAKKYFNISNVQIITAF